MNILELASQDPNALADEDFIEKALSDLESDIRYVEQKHNMVLVGDRADFDRVRHDWRIMTRAQVAYAVSYWRRGIFERYAKR